MSVGFQEFFTLFNPTNEPLSAALVFYGASGSILHVEPVNVPAGPGLSQVHVNTVLPSSEHSTNAYAYGRETGQPAAIVVERLMRWNGVEGHRSTGASSAYPFWEFAEGGSGAFSTFVALWNPNATAATVRVYYRHENGNLYSQDVALAALGRAVVGTPSWVPSGGFGIEIYPVTGEWVFAERMVYGGTNWTIGHASPGARTGVGTSQTWWFAEGSSAGMFETYFLLTNIAGSPASVTLTYRTAAGTVIGTDSLTIPTYGRGTVWANGTTGGQDFSTEVTSTQPLMAERAMYWPTGSSSSLSAGGSEALATTEETDGTAKTAAPTTMSVPYTLTEGTPGPTVLGTEASKEVVVGRRAPSSRTAAEGGASTQSSGGVTSWYGSHLTVGKRP